MSYSLVRGSARSLPLADESVDLVVTSPPYFGLRSYKDAGKHYNGQIGSELTPQEYLESLWTVTAECKRVLKPSGSLFVNLGDKYVADNRGSGADTKRGAAKYAPAGFGRQKSLMLLPERYRIGCVDQLGLIARSVIIWGKPNGLPESVTDRVRRSHEDWVHLTKEPRYFSSVDEVREPHKSEDRPRPLGSSNRTPYHEQATDNVGWKDHEVSHNHLGRLPGSVWTIATEPLQVPDSLGVDHFAAFPQEWPRRLILGWSPSGICVECGEGRRQIRGRTCDECGALVEVHTKTCLSCGGRRGSEWREGRSVNPDMHGDEHGAGLAAPRKARTTREATETGGYACACPEPTAPTRPAVVLDPFVGTGTTVMVANVLGRYGIGVDLSADYLRLAEWRCRKSGHASKSIRRTWNEHNEEVPLFEVAP